MKTIIAIITVGILTWVLGTALPWWSIALAGFIGGLAFGSKASQAFVISLLGTGIAWLLMCFLINQNNDALLSTQIGQVLGGLSPILLILIVVVLGGLVSGLAGCSGFFFRKIIRSA